MKAVCFCKKNKPTTQPIRMLPKQDLKCTLLVLKVASRCNLNCTYCYMYNLGDETYRKQPKRMSDAVVDALLRRVKNHCVRHRIEYFDFNFHGGEPLLAGPDFFRKFVTKANHILRPATTPIFSMQTNGTLLTDEWCDLLGELDIHVGISLDGTPEANDMYRIDHAGKGSYHDIIKGIRVAMQSTSLNGRPGLLSVINVKSDPVAVYEHFKSINPLNIDFLLPDANHETPPPGIEDAASETPYADWLIAVYDQWFYEKKPFGITVFESILRLILGNNEGSDVLGAVNKEHLIIETNGGIEPVGQLKICGNGFTKVGVNVLHNELDDVLGTELGLLFHLSGKKICKFCQSCPVQSVCSSGYLPHRYSKAKGFNNPSVYCKDLLKLITHIQNSIFKVIPHELLRDANMEPLYYGDAREILASNAGLLAYADHDLESFGTNHEQPVTL